MMNRPTPSFSRTSPRVAAVVATLALLGSSSFGVTSDPTLLDDFSDPVFTSTGAPRLLINDQAMGGQSTAELSCREGVMSIKGSLIPGRGAPAFTSFAVVLSPTGQPTDLSRYQGVLLRMKVHSGAISVQVSSTEVDNHDYHSSPVTSAGAEHFQEVRLPFESMKRAWSSPTALNPKSVTSVNVVAFGIAKGDFAYEIDEIRFY